MKCPNCSVEIPESPKPPDRWSGAPIYAALVQLRNTELAAYWTRYNIQAAINLGMLVATLNASSTSTLSIYSGYVSLGGLVLVTNWAWMIYRSKQLLTGMWEGELRAFEQHHLGKPAEDSSNAAGWKLFSENKVPPASWATLCEVMKQPLTLPAMVGPLLCFAAWTVLIIRACCY